MASPLSPRSQEQPTSHPPEDEDEEMLDADQEDDDEEPQNEAESSTTQQDPRRARENRKDKDLNTFLNSMDKYAPIVSLIERSLMLMPRFPTQ
jgi:hypothetical protein